MLREILDSQDDIKKQIDTKTNILEIESNNDYYLIENLNQLKKVLDKISSSKALASTQEINRALKKITIIKRSRTLYSHNLAIDLNEEYN